MSRNIVHPDGNEQADNDSDDGSRYIPSPEPDEEEVDPSKIDFTRIVKLSQDDVREALMGYVKEQTCFGKTCARDHVINEIVPSGAIHYILETFCEQRTTEPQTVPYYDGGLVDGPENGNPPKPWDMKCQPKEFFKDEVRLSEMEHTDTVENCSTCGSTGHVKCRYCDGRGIDRCMKCGASGQVSKYDDEKRTHVKAQCEECCGSGEVVCSPCHGAGRDECSMCSGAGKLKTYIELSIAYKNYVSQYVLQKAELPASLMTSVGGIVIFEQQMEKVPPIESFPEKEINEHSLKLIKEHKKSFADHKLWQQRHRLRVVPVSEVRYTWKEKPLKYWIYGMERKVLCDDYPQQCCWGCELL